MNKRVAIVAVLIVIVLGTLSLYRLLLLQYDSGDAYPAYSSFRADPMGVLIFYDALAATRGAAPERNLAPLDRATFSKRSTLLLAGASISEDEVSTLERIETYVDEGGRFVVLFRPGQEFVVNNIVEEKDRKKKEADDEAAGKSKDDKKPERRGSDDMMEALLPMADISDRWGFAYAVRDLPKEGVIATRGELAPENLPGELTWHSSLIFTDIAPEWVVVYERDHHPVVIERTWGEGRIVVATDNYLVSNEAMLNDRAPGYLAWLVDSDRVPIFDETHLGVVSSVGVMTLARRYGLIPVLVAAVLLTLLVIWRNASPLVPKHSGPREGDTVVAAHNTIAGLAGLVRRAVKHDDIVETCWRLFQVPSMRRRPIDQGRRARVEAELTAYKYLPARRRDAVATYNHISAIINERKPNP